MNKVFVIAEMSANHNHHKQIALDTIYAAKEAGADAIKIQTYTADTITLDCHFPDFMVGDRGLWDGMNLYELYQQAYTPWEWHEEIFQEAKKIGISCFSTPFEKPNFALTLRPAPPAQRGSARRNLPPRAP